MGRFSASLVARRWLAPGVLEVKLTRPADVTFMPGQFLRVVMDGYERDYTMVSAPDAETLDFCIAVVDKGRFSSQILSAGIGTSFQVSAPHGHFVFHGPGNPAVFVATGTGVAPFVAFCRCGVEAALMLHGADSPDRLIYRDLLQPVLHDYVPCISRLSGAHAGQETIYPHRVTRYLDQQLRPGTYDFYLCGRRSMIRDATAIIDERFGSSRLFIETYD